MTEDCLDDLTKEFEVEANNKLQVLIGKYSLDSFEVITNYYRNYVSLVGLTPTSVLVGEKNVLVSLGYEALEKTIRDYEGVYNNGS